MKKNSRIIIIVLAVLLVTTAVGAFYNRQYNQEKAALLAKAEIAVREEGKEIARLKMDDIDKLPTAKFSARFKSSVMKSAQEHIYTGIAFSDLFTSAGIALDGKKSVLVKSVDGYAVPITIKEIQELDNVYLVYKDNGDYLGAYGKVDGQGPYMIVIRGDHFSQRWAKYVCELDVQ